ncbi:MAG TPA: cytochrome c peroxidase [Longimicrobiales bacterium]|nr:cytochrome c peroxidase [Longimicrobiales bacterium]
MDTRGLTRLAGIGATLLVALLGAHSAPALGCPPAARPRGLTTCSSDVDLRALMAQDPDARRLRREIDSIFTATVAEAARPTADPAGQVTLLGKMLLYDKTLSVDRNMACVECHDPRTGFTGGIESINRTVVAYVNSTGQFVSPRKPQSIAYAAFSPRLHYNRTQKDFYGGNFWDMRATGVRLANPAAEQAQGPPTNPLEMALADPACVVYLMSRRPYRALFEKVWGAQSFGIAWPANVEKVCSTPGPPPANDPFPVHLDPKSRGIASSTYDAMALAIASYEASPEVSPFSSKFDSALAHPTQQVLTADEQAGWELFRGKARCNACHLDGTQAGPAARPIAAAARPTTDAVQPAPPTGTPVRGAVSPADAANVAPLFTDFTSANLGVPRNPALRFYCENKPNAAGFTPNPDGAAFVDHGVAGFLRSKQNPDREWARLADGFDGAFQVPTLRNVDMRPRPGFVRPYAHNGYFKSLKEIVHFYNTRDVLPRCRGENDPGEKVRCWPAPEVGVNVDSTVGKLGLTDHEEDQLVAFLRTLTDVLPPGARR